MSNDRTENNISPIATSLNLTDQEFTYVLLSSLGFIVAGGGYALYRSAQDGRSFQLPEYRYVDPYTAHPNDGAIKALVKRGYASIDEILEAAYGEWPVKGLNIVSTNPQEVFFENYTDDVVEGRPGRLAEAKVVNETVIYQRFSAIFIQQIQ